MATFHYNDMIVVHKPILVVGRFLWAINVTYSLRDKSLKSCCMTLTIENFLMTQLVLKNDLATSQFTIKLMFKTSATFCSIFSEEYLLAREQYTFTGIV